MNLIGNSTVAGSEKIKGMQSGRIQDYAFAFLGGLVILVIIVVYNLM
jgi:NADH-quinone oxidoreductase subunit L